MIWSSRARNRSPTPVVSCFFGRIVPSDAAQNHGSSKTGIPKTNLQASAPADPETLQSQNNLLAENRISINGLAVVHGRRATPPIIFRTLREWVRALLG